MGIPVLIMGASGSGKSASLRNFTKEEISVLNVTNKPLPFKNNLPTKNNATYDIIAESLANPNKKAYCIDDAVLNMTKENFSRALETGYTKFTEMAMHFYQMLEFIQTKVPDDVIVYIITHTETEDGKIHAKTLGKMLDSSLGGGIESLVTICLRATQTDGGYKFITGGELNSTAKSPMGMFETKEIENDLKIVDTAIREYYNLSPLNSKPATKTKEDKK